MKNKWALAAIAVLCWAVAASLISGYYYYQYNDLAKRIREAKINLGIDYGNGTRIWHNNTIGTTLYDAMQNAGWKLDAKSYGAMGTYIKAINSLEESVTEYKYWSWWAWTEYGWYHGMTACDKYVLSPGETILWYYSPTDPTTYEMSPPP